MEEAKRLLRVTDMSVKKISVLLRYNDVAYFVKQFKRITGMTCTDYRISKNGQGKKK
jgi:YesN/AraC family two-component response regulator